MRSLIPSLGILAGLLAFPLAGDAARVAHAAMHPAAHASPVSVAPARPDPDSMLIEIYRALSTNNLRLAEQKAEALVAAYPNFHLGQLIRGDLLMMHTRSVQALGAAPGAPPERLQNLRQEAAARLRALRERPDPNLVPSVLVQLRPDQKVAFVVDARRSRLYVYENQDGWPQLKADYYVSQGKLGVDKLREGDQKTPLGVYYVTSRLEGRKLPDFYGPGALPLSYPNEWDRLNGRGGSGIWLHGTPSDSFSRPPLSSDGCVVLTNPDLLRLAQSAEVGKTPVVIAQEVRFVTRDALQRERALAASLTEAWRRDFESRDEKRLAAHYSRNFRSEQGNLGSWVGRQIKWLSAVRGASLAMRELSVFQYPGAGELMVATFVQNATVNGRNIQTQRLRQYWSREGNAWRIVAETAWQ